MRDFCSVCGDEVCIDRSIFGDDSDEARIISGSLVCAKCELAAEEAERSREVSGDE